MEKKHNCIHTERKNLFFYVFALIIFCFAIMLKQNYHVDEIYSFGLANNYGNIYIDIQDGHKYKPADKPYINYMTVDKNKRFDYGNVWKNQGADVHPVLYYILVHTICSLFPSTISKWYLGIINIFFMLATLFAFRKLLQKLTNNTLLLQYASIFFIFSQAILDIVCFFRMYIMAMFFVTIVTYLLLQVYDEEIFSWKKQLSILVVVVLGSLTHYYFIVYLVALCLSVGIGILIQKNWKKFFNLILLMALSESIAIIIFPQMIQHIFFSNRGEESFANLGNSILTYWNSIRTYFRILNYDLMGGMLGYSVVILGIVLIFENIINKKYKIEKENRKVQINRCMILGASIFIYFCIIAKIAVYQTDRYISPIYAVVIAFVFILIEFILSHFKITQSNKCVIFTIMIAVALVNSWTKGYWEYTYINSLDTIEKAKQYGTLDCFFIYNGPWRVQPNYLEIKEYNSSTFYQQDSYTDIFANDDFYQKEFMVYTVSDYNADEVLKNIIQHNPLVNKYEKISSYGYSYSNCFHVFSKNIDIYDVAIYSYDKKYVLSNDNENIKMTDIVQTIQMIEEKDNKYITLFMDNKVVDIKNGEYKNGNNVQLYQPNNSEAQHWIICKNQDGTVTFLAQNNEYALTRTNTGDVVIEKYNLDNVQQKWWIE